MEMQKVDSSNIHAIGYDSENKILEIIFKPKMTNYIYEKIEPEIYDAFLKADSKGKFFTANIRGKFETKKVERRDVDITPKIPVGHIVGPLPDFLEVKDDFKTLKKGVFGDSKIRYVIRTKDEEQDLTEEFKEMIE